MPIFKQHPSLRFINVIASIKQLCMLTRHMRSIASSAGGVSVCSRRLGGRGLADRPGALRQQQGPGLHRGRGGEAPEEARGL